MNWGCVSKANHFFKRMWYCTTITWKHDSSVSLGFKTMSIFHDLCHTKVRIPIVYEKYMTWTYPLELCILCYIHIPVHLMLQSGDISCFLFQGGISSWNLPHFEPNDYHCSKECIVQLNRCFSLGQASSFQTSYLIMTISQRTQEHEDSLLSSAGNKPLSMKKMKKGYKMIIDLDNLGPLISWISHPGGVDGTGLNCRIRLPGDEIHFVDERAPGMVMRGLPMSLGWKLDTQKRDAIV